MTLRARLLLVILLILLGGGAFYLRTLANRIFIEPAQHAEEAARAKLNAFALQSNKAPTQTATLYFPDLEQGKLVAESRAVAWAEADGDRVRQVILALAEGSHQVQGHLLPATLNVRAVFLAGDGTAYVDLAHDALGEFPPGIQTETLAIYSLVDSIAANVPSVKRIQFLIEGQNVETLDGHADLTAAYVPDASRIKPGS